MAASEPAALVILADVALLVLGDEDAFDWAREKTVEVGLAQRERQAAVIFAVGN